MISTYESTQSRRKCQDLGDGEVDEMMKQMKEGRCEPGEDHELLNQPMY